MARRLHRIDDQGPELTGQLFELLLRQRAQFGGAGDRFEQHGQWGSERTLGRPPPRRPRVPHGTRPPVRRTTQPVGPVPSRVTRLTAMPGLDADLDRVVDVVAFQATACAQSSSPLYGRILDAVVADLRTGGVTAELLTGRGDDPVGSALALRFLGAVHRIVLDGRAPDLAAFYPSMGGVSEGDPGPAFLRTVEHHRDEVSRHIDDGVQTNEVGRSAALVGGFAEVARTTGLPLRVLERPLAERGGRQGQRERTLLPAVMEHRLVGFGLGLDRSEAMHAAEIVTAVHRARALSPGDFAFSTPIMAFLVTNVASSASVQPSVPDGRSGRTNEVSPTSSSRPRISTSSGSSVPSSASTPRGFATARARYGGDLYQPGGSPSTGHG